MDKHTLSNYGWIIILTLVMGVMLAIASPFGNYVGDGIVNIANAYGIVNEDAVNVSNVESMSDEWEGKFHEWGNGASATKCCDAPNVITYGDDTKCNNCGAVTYGNDTHNGIIPEGGIYYQGDLYCPDCYFEFGNVESECYCKAWGAPEGFGMVGQRKEYTAGNVFPTIQTSDTYRYNGILYGYNVRCDNYSKSSYGVPKIDTINGWFAYSEISVPTIVLSNINGYNVKNMEYFGMYITDVSQLQIPNTVTDISSMFHYNTSITSIKDLVIPDSVTDISYLCINATMIRELPAVIPSSVTNMTSSFAGLYFAGGTIEINANPTQYNDCFLDTGRTTLYVDEPEKEIIITGSCTTATKQVLASTGTNVRY